MAARTRRTPGAGRQTARKKATAGRRAAAARRTAKSATPPHRTIRARFVRSLARVARSVRSAKGAAKWSSPLRSARTAAFAQRGSPAALGWHPSTRRRCKRSARPLPFRPSPRARADRAGISRSRSPSCVDDKTGDTRLFLFKGLHSIAARRGDGLRQEFLELFALREAHGRGQCRRTRRALRRAFLRRPDRTRSARLAIALPEGVLPFRKSRIEHCRLRRNRTSRLCGAISERTCHVHRDEPLQGAKRLRRGV